MFIIYFLYFLLDLIMFCNNFVLKNVLIYYFYNVITHGTYIFSGFLLKLCTVNPVLLAAASNSVLPK